MLEFIRRHSSSMVVKIFLTVLALTFVFCFGISDVIRKITGKDFIVKIGNVKITPEIFKREKAKKLGMLKNQKKSIDEKTLTAGILHEVIWENIINQASTEFGFVVSDSAMKKYVSGLDMFRDDSGRFNANLLRGFLQKIHVSEEMFLETSKKDIKAALLRAPLKYVSIVSEAEKYTLANLEKRNLTVVELNPISFKIDDNVTQEELEEFYTNNPDDFMVDETRSFRVVELQESAIEKNIKISEEDIKDAYDFSPEKEERTYDEMKAELESNLKQEKLQGEVNEITRQIEDALMAGEELAEVAKKFNLKVFSGEDVSLNKNQKAISQCAYKEDVMSVAFSIDEGTDSSFSEALDKQKNRVLWLVHVDSITPKHVEAFAKVTDKVHKAWRKNKQHEKAIELANEFVEKMKDRQNLAKLAEKKGRISNITPVFNRFGTSEDKQKFADIIKEVHVDAFNKEKFGGAYAEINGIPVVYQVKSIIQAKKVEPKDREKYYTMLVRETVDDMYQQLIGYLSKRYKVTINYEMLKESNEETGRLDDIF